MSNHREEQVEIELGNSGILAELLMLLYHQALGTQATSNKLLLTGSTRLSMGMLFYHLATEGGFP